MDIASFLKGFAGLLWLIVVSLIVLAVVRASRGQKVRALQTSILVTAILAILLTTISAGLVFIRPEERPGQHCPVMVPQAKNEVNTFGACNRRLACQPLQLSTGRQKLSI